MHYSISEAPCMEVFKTGGIDDGKLLGYAIFFAGSWDAWQLEPVGYRFLKRIGSAQTKEESIRLILE